jgi:LmbE family N-acetylglucosaminyl deacetylase
MKLDFKKVLVIAPHLDDETIALGGTIRKFTKARIDVNIIIVGGHLPPIYNKKNYIITKKESQKALKILGVKQTYYLDCPALEFHKNYYQIINSKIYNIINNLKPNVVFIPFPDRHIDHRTVFDCAMVNTRPNKKFYPKLVLCYETLSETHWNAPYIEPNFTPDFFINIENTLKEKIKALNCYQSQIKGNQSRSIESIEALAKFRGSQNGCRYAEGFKLIRAII